MSEHHEESRRPPLIIVPASAGSGKTHYIQETLAHEIKENGLAPEKIVAVTFTEAAAAELRGRIRGALVKAGMLDQALLLDQAYISTIHGFGLRILTEYAFDAGISPTPRMLNEDEQAMLSSRSLASSDHACGMMEHLDRYGYKFDFNSKKTPEDNFKESLLKFIAILRTIGRDAGGEGFVPWAELKIRELYGETRAAEHLKDALLSAVHSLLQRFPNNMADICTFGTTVEPKVRQNYRDLKAAAKGDPLDTDWKLWNNLRKLHVYKSKSPYPAGYDDLANDVIAAAEALPLHPGPLNDALEHARSLILSAAEALHHYSAHKTGRGLVDFTDMLSQAHRLLCGNPKVMSSFRERVSCLVIDEFQDTNPLQFAMLWALTRQGVPTIVVGDLKQAIMGFQGADARLMGQLIERNPADIKPLGSNYRSSKELMEWINSISSGLFGRGYADLTPEAKFTSRLTPLEVVQTGEKSLKDDVLASHTVARLHALLNDETQYVYDKKIKAHRRLRGGDIAIISPWNKRLQHYAAALRGAGIRCRLEQEGWLESDAVRLACYGLNYAADPDDAHAALYLAVAGPGSHMLQTALDELVGGRDLADPFLAQLKELHAVSADMPIDDVLERVLAILNLYGRGDDDVDPLQTRANLLRLQQECRDFRSANRDAMACGGYYGADAKTFLAWLKGRAKRENGQPEPAVIDENAVQLTSWHKSKGKEWPVVVVCATDISYDPRLPSTRVTYGSFDDLDALLDQAKVEFFPDFVAAETQASFEGALAAECHDGAMRLLYVALTRAREKIILEWPDYQSAKEVNSYWKLLVSSAGLELHGNKMRVGGKQFDCRVNAAGKEPWSIEPAASDGIATRFGRPALLAGDLPTSLTPEMVIPSSLHGADVSALPLVRTVSYAGPLSCDLSGMGAGERGTLLHRAFEVLSGYPERREFLAEAVAFPLAEEQAERIAAAVTSFDVWLQSEFRSMGVVTELPFLVTDDRGSVVSGLIDMVVETPEGLWVIDHKSDQTEDRAERFGYYQPQLQAYVAALRKARPEQAILGMGVNWISYGQVTLCEI